MVLQKMSELILATPEFLEMSYERRETSVFNKQLHDVMITAIEARDRQHVEEVLMNKTYMEPLKGVIYCMNTCFDVTTKFLDVFDEEEG